MRSKPAAKRRHAKNLTCQGKVETPSFCSAAHATVDGRKSIPKGKMQPNRMTPRVSASCHLLTLCRLSLESSLSTSTRKGDIASANKAAVNESVIRTVFITSMLVDLLNEREAIAGSDVSLSLTRARDASTAGEKLEHFNGSRFVS